MEHSLQRPPLRSSSEHEWHHSQVEHHCQPPHRMSEQTFPAHIIEVGLRYEATELKVNGQLYKAFEPGNIAIHPAHAPISVESYGEAEFIAIALEPVFISTLAERAVESIELIPQISGRDPLIFQLALALRQAIDHPSPPIYSESIATALAAHLLQKYTQPDTSFVLTSGGLSLRQRRQIVDYIHTYLGQPLSLTRLSAVISMSPGYFATLFKQSMGISPYRYILQQRIRRAQQLLTGSQLAISDIAHQVGFSSQSHFTKVFRSHSGMTPRIYRQSR